MKRVISANKNIIQTCLLRLPHWFFVATRRKSWTIGSWEHFFRTGVQLFSFFPTLTSYKALGASLYPLVHNNTPDVKQALFVLLEGSIQPIRSFQSSSSSSWILCNLLETVRYHYPSLHLQRNIRLADLRHCWPLLISQPLRIGQRETSLQDKKSSTPSTSSHTLQKKERLSANKGTNCSELAGATRN